MPNSLSALFIRAALVFLGIGVSIGVLMSLSHDFTIRPVHVHVNLLGWVGFFAYGVFYMLFPAAAASKAATVHFWSAITGTPTMMIGLLLVVLGYTGPGVPLLLAGELVAVVSVMTFIYVGFLATASRGQETDHVLSPAQ